MGVQWPQAATLHLRFCEGWPLPGGLLEVMQAQLCKGQDGMSGRGDPEFQKEVAAILVSAVLAWLAVQCTASQTLGSVHNWRYHQRKPSDMW